MMRIASQYWRNTRRPRNPATRLAATDPPSCAASLPFSETPMLSRARRSVLLRDLKVLIDGGANRGQYATLARGFGFQRRIVSFEPELEAFRALVATAAADGQWEPQLALGTRKVNSAPTWPPIPSGRRCPLPSGARLRIGEDDESGWCS